MSLLITFLVIVLIAIVGVSWLGVVIDGMTSSFISLAIFFPMFFATIWATWKLAVKITEPKSTTNP